MINCDIVTHHKKERHVYHKIIIMPNGSSKPQDLERKQLRLSTSVTQFTTYTFRIRRS